MNGNYRTAINKLIEDVGNKCELCGNSRGLEVHHLIPRCCKLSNIDLDVEDNLIVVCSSCHGKLTPNGFLIKYGIAKKQETRNLATSFYNKCLEELDNDSDLTVSDVFTIFDNVFLNKE